VIAYMVGERTQEIGIRLALGAPRRRIFESVLRQAIRLAAVGMAAGLIGAVIVARLMASVLYGTRPTDPLTYLTVTGVLAVMALLAGCVPAWRAIRVDPVAALR
jgi:ABC-type antimicrobial peptide transport system permease subunit